ncbi:Lysophospholipase L1 [Gracilibacillus ureilyticus]|uniref:Lysophospholipase L1 n=1 Tax=Gracilibacillus ureilyticus TaxID=531814 RepID=A0A1H9SYN8_9BACI|nr:SGNH/GDSL hydrolase family protein [Gracilibacillus ureilyticus]SER89493.1 Lysophospholipase L1 [Gracilibacillus ureilyticus]
MNKKIIITIFILLIVCGAIFLTINFNKQDNQNSRQTTSVDNPPETSEQELNIEEKTTNEETVSEEQTETADDEIDNIGETVKDVVIDALTFFKKDTHIVAIGDSLTQGVGDETESGGYVGVLEEHFDNEDVKVTIDNFGKRGNRTDQLLKRLENEEIVSSIQDADIVLITIGANDIMKILKDNFMDLTEEPFIEERGPYKERIDQILSRILEIQPETDIYLLGFYNPFEKYFSDIEALDNILTRWNNESQNVAGTYDQVTFIPMQDIYENRSENMYAEDNFHPNRRGYEEMAKRVWSYLQNNEDLVTN